MSAPVYEHRGEEIEFQDRNEMWVWGEYSNASLAKVKEQIDRQMPKRWQPTEAYNYDYDAKLKRVTVTSPTADGHFMIAGTGRRKREKSRRPLYAITKANDNHIARIVELVARRDEINAQINAIYRDGLEPLKPEHLKEIPESA